MSKQIMASLKAIILKFGFTFRVSWNGWVETTKKPQSTPQFPLLLEIWQKIPGKECTTEFMESFADKIDGSIINGGGGFYGYCFGLKILVYRL